MKFKSKHIKGKGRGKILGFPTINLKIPSNFKLEDGIYAAKVFIEDKVFTGALHYGPVLTFEELDKSLEVYLIDLNDDNKLKNLYEIVIKVEIIEYLRPVMKFNSEKALVSQIKKDVKQIKALNHKLQKTNKS
jgi:riboflavin kinase/FMN adenylyltransferase